MFTYYYRIKDKYKHTIVSLAVLADENKNWRPNSYESSMWGCSIKFQFPIAKMLDYGED